MQINNELKILAEILRKIFREVYDKLKDKKLNNKILDEEVLKIVENIEIQKENLEIKFSEPEDTIYTTEGGRTPYDLLCYGKINGKEFKIFINNKFGDLFSKTRNDVTTYNNLLRLYLGISTQRLTSKITIDGNLVFNRVSGKELVAYALFVIDKKVDKKGRGHHKFFLLEEMKDSFYVNPRNTMFQVRYNPPLGDPVDYYTFCIKLIDAILEALKKSLSTIETEILVLKTIQKELIEIKKRVYYGEKW